MTPEQLQQYVDAALKQRDQFNLVFYPLTVILVSAALGSFLTSAKKERTLQPRKTLLKLHENKKKYELN
jgi:hypothetical protein